MACGAVVGIESPLEGTGESLAVEFVLQEAEDKRESVSKTSSQNLVSLGFKDFEEESSRLFGAEAEEPGKANTQGETRQAKNNPRKEWC